MAKCSHFKPMRADTLYKALKNIENKYYDDIVEMQWDNLPIETLVRTQKTLLWVWRDLSGLRAKYMMTNANRITANEWLESGVLFDFEAKSKVGKHLVNFHKMVARETYREAGPFSTYEVLEYYIIDKGTGKRVGELAMGFSHRTICTFAELLALNQPDEKDEKSANHE